MVLQSCQVEIINEREILNVVTSKAPKVASRPAGGMALWGLWVLEAPSGVGAEPLRKKMVNKMKKKYNPPVDHQVSRPANFLGLRAIFR